MRIYSRFGEAYKETERELIEMGTLIHPETMQDINTKGDDRFLTKELQGYGYIITSPFKRDKDFVELGGDIDYAELEFSERVNANWINPGTAWQRRHKVWEGFIREGFFSYTYNERLREQLDKIIKELYLRPNTRQAVVTMYDRHQDMNNIGGSKRIPCSMYYQFLRRERSGKEYVDIIYTMRSCDIYTHMIYDMWFTMKLQEYVANSIGLEPGRFTHFVGSLHAYKRDWETKGVF